MTNPICINHNIIIFKNKYHNILILILKIIRLTINKHLDKKL